MRVLNMLSQLLLRGKTGTFSTGTMIHGAIVVIVSFPHVYYQVVLSGKLLDWSVAGGSLTHICSLLRVGRRTMAGQIATFPKRLLPLAVRFHAYERIDMDVVEVYRK